MMFNATRLRVCTARHCFKAQGSGGFRAASLKSACGCQTQ